MCLSVDLTKGTGSDIEVQALGYKTISTVEKNIQDKTCFYFCVNWCKKAVKTISACQSFRFARRQVDVYLGAGFSKEGVCGLSSTFD